MKMFRLFVAFTLICLALSPRAQAVSPAPDGCYPGFTTAEGCNALQLLSTGAGNAAFGWKSLAANTTGSYNTGVGAGTLVVNNADSNTAVGAAALLLNTTGTQNTAVGTDALVHNDSGNYNTAVGAFALFNSAGPGPSSSFNTAIGGSTLHNNMTGDSNVAVGIAGCCGAALFSNTTGRFNTAVGGGALGSNTGGGDNTAIGPGALQNNVMGFENVAVGLSALNQSTGSNNIALGNYAGFMATTGDSNIYIGYEMEGTAGESNACYIASIDGQTSASGVAVLINSNGKLGTTTSSRRFKEDIKPMDNASDALFALAPVTFRYKKQLDPQGIQQWGLVAEDVQKVNPALVALDKAGKPYSVRYDQVNAMLLNEFLKEHRTVQEQGATITELKKQVAALAAGLQKVSAQLEVSKPLPQTVANNQ